MAKKVATNDVQTIEGEQTGKQPKKKKKRSWCCTCCIILLVVNLVLLIGIGVAGWFIGDKFTKQLFNMSIGDTLGVLGDLYGTDDKDVVNNPFSDDDAKGFYNEIKRNVLLKESAEIDFDGALDKAIDNYLGGNKTDPAALSSSSEAGDGNNENGNNENGNNENGENKEEGDNEIVNILTDMIAGVLTRDNLDLELLNAYPETDEYIFRLNDKQLAAFLNIAVNKVLANFGKIEGMEQIAQMVDLKKVVALKQIRFTASRTGEGENAEVSASSAEVTVWVGVQSAANQVIKKYMTELGVGWLGGFAGWIGDVILPENMYITLSVPLYGEDNKPDININAMDEKSHTRAVKLADGVLGLMNSDSTLESMLDGVVDSIKPLLSKATEKMNFDHASEGTLSIDLLDAVAKMASGEGEGEPLTKADFLFMLQALMSDQAKQLNSLVPYRFNNWYLDNEKVPVFVEEGSATLTPIDYEKEFIQQIENKYAVNFGENAKLNDVLSMIGISLDGSDNSNAGSTDLIDLLDGERFNALLDEEDISKLKINITDRMLGAALAGQMDKILSSGEMENVSLELLAISFVEPPAGDDENSTYALLAVRANLSEMLSSLTADGGSLIGQIATGLMPESILLTVSVDITRGVQPDSRGAAKFVINSCTNTDNAISSLQKIVPSLNIAEISNTVGGKLNEMLDQMESTLDGITLSKSNYRYDETLDRYIGSAGALVMPDIFDIVTKMVLTDEEDKPIVTPEQLKNVVRDLNNPHAIDSNINKDAGYAAFIDEVLDKYYFKAEKGTIKNFDELTAYLQDFDTSKFRVTGADGLAHDSRTIPQLKPTMTGGELGTLLLEKMGGVQAIESYEIVAVNTGADKLDVVLGIKLSDLMTGDEGAKIQKLFTAEELFITADFDLADSAVLGDGSETDPYRYPVNIKINIDRSGTAGVMDEPTYEAMLKVVKKFVPDFDIEDQVKEFGKILYDQMDTLNSSITSMGGAGDQPIEPSENEVKIFRFTDEGLQIEDFYTFLALKMNPSLLDNHTSDDIRRTVQGLYRRDDTAPNANNFDPADFIHNPPTLPYADESKPCGTVAWTVQQSGAMYDTPIADADFNGFVKKGMTSISDKEETLNVSQTIVLAAGDNSQKAADVRKWLNDGLKASASSPDLVTADGNYLVLTFAMGMGAFAASGNGAEGIFADEIYITVVYEYDEHGADNNKFKAIGGNSEAGTVNASVIFNGMTNTEYEIIMSLMNLSPDASAADKVNINTIIGQSTTVLNEITYKDLGGGHSVNTDISFAALTSGEGIGTIKLVTSIS